LREQASRRGCQVFGFLAAAGPGHGVAEIGFSSAAHEGEWYTGGAFPNRDFTDSGIRSMWGQVKVVF
jgi:hypothetical protein